MKAELRRKQILDVSTAMFSEHGYHQTHVEMIIKAARVGKGTFYRYFKNKEDLFSNVLQRFLNNWEAEVFIDPSAFTSDTIFEHFFTLTVRTFEFFKKNEDLCNIYLRVNTGLGDAFQPYMERFETRMMDYVSRYLEAGIQLGYVRPDVNPEMASSIIVGAFLRVEYFYFVLHKGDTPDIDQLATDFFAIVMSGVLKHGNQFDEK